MSLLIPGMKMPTSCFDCPMCYDSIGCIVTGEQLWSDSHVYLDFSPNKERMWNCPLIELPPHGDLIDRNHLEVVSYHNTEGMEDTFDNGVKWMLEYIDKLTPVISAEGGAGNG